MINYTTSKTDLDLAGIRELQKKNLAPNLEASEISIQGFLTVSHSAEDLKKMHTYEHNIIAKHDDKVIGYLLAMTKKSKGDIPILIPMFQTFDEITFKGKLVSGYNYIVVGQVCIQKDFRGQGILDNCYQAYKDYFSDKYDFAITEIATSNQRSINAHKRIGFAEIHRCTDSNNIEWTIVVWDWHPLSELAV